MALPFSGQLSLNDIRVELGESQGDNSLGDMSDTAGFSAPDAVSDFYGYSHSTITLRKQSNFGQFDAFGACFQSLTVNRYSNGGANFTNGDIIYTNAAGTTTFNGGNAWFKQGTTSARISSSGVVSLASSC